MSTCIAALLFAVELVTCNVQKDSWTVGSERLVVCTSPDTNFFVMSRGKAGDRVLLEVPGDAEADYTAAPPVVTVTTYTWRSEREPRIPLVRHYFTLSATGVTQQSFFVLRGRPFSAERFRRHIREFENPANSGEKREALLYLLRDYGVSKPERALELLKPLEPDAHLGEMLDEIRYELELARDLPRP